MCHVAASHQAAFRELGFAKFDKSFVDEHIEYARVCKIHQSGQQGGAGHRVLPTSGQYRQGVAEDGAPHAKTQGVNLRHIANAPCHLNGFQSAFFHIVVPGGVGHGGVGVTPTHHESAVTLRHRIANQRVGGLKIKDVKLVDARGYQQKRPLIDLGCEGFVFQQLEQLVFKHHCTLCGGNVFAHLKQALIRHGHMALLQIVQHVLYALGNALAFGVYGFLLRLGVEGQKIAGR